MKIAFHDNNCSFRGTTVSTFNYAHFHELIDGGTSYFAFQKHGNANNQEMIETVRDRFPDRVLAYDHFDQVDPWLKKNNVSALYMQKGGNWDGLISLVVPTWVHAVFPNNIEPHGSAFAFISEWLSEEVEKRTGVKYPWIPYIIDLPNTLENLRENLNISPEATVFGNLSGEEFATRDVGWVRDVIVDYAIENPDVYFIFRTPVDFGPNLPNIKFLSISTDVVEKRKFINTCDAMIHARWNGESFGAAIAEFAACDKPVIHWIGGQDQNHTRMLQNHPSYTIPKKLVYAMDNVRNGLNKVAPSGYWSECVTGFTPRAVMTKFYEIFK